MTAALGIAAASRALQEVQPLAVLRWATANVGRVAFATGFGAEGCVLIDLIARDRLPIDLFTLDTGLLFPETYELWQQLEARYRIAIRAVRPAQTVEQQAAEHGPELWQRAPDRCCELRKLAPLREALRDYDGWITAIRRDQTPERAHAQLVEHDRRFDLVKVNPLVAWTHDDVWAYISAHDVPYNALHERGYPSIGCAPCTSAIVPGEALRAGRWRGAGKTECGIHAAKAPK
ncbi:MAG TPA: phosphoadenylyl-sulfate reductase [Kofleriaceae bacterium]|nr:phosphoadenylyl-sulfate reductase [Kofleriaceae bacterium]